MKLKYCLAALLALSSLVSCKIDNGENKPAEATAPKEEVVATGKVMVSINAIVPKDDNFQIFYTEDGSLDFNGDHAVTVSVVGKPEAQTIRFALPDDSLPAALRLDTGENKAQGKIVVDNFTVNYFDKSLVIKGGNEFLKYFQSNNVGTENPTDASVTLVTKEADGSYDPMFYPTGDLINTLKTILVK